MPIKEASFWVFLTMFGTGLYFLFEPGHRMAAASLLVAGLIGIGNVVILHHYPHAALPSKGVWVWLALFVTWIFLGYTIRELPTTEGMAEFDAQNDALVISYGEELGGGYTITVNSSLLLDRQTGYKLAVGCFIYDGKEDLIDAPYLQVSNLYDIANGRVTMRASYKQYFWDYAKQVNANGITIALLNVPNGVRTDQFSTLRQARALGVKIPAVQTAAMQQASPAAR